MKESEGEAARGARCLRAVACLHAKWITGDGQIRTIHHVLTVDAAGALRRLHAVLDQLL